MKDDPRIQIYVRVYRFDKGEAAQVGKVNFTCILARSASRLLNARVKKLEIGIASQQAFHVQLQLHGS